MKYHYEESLEKKVWRSTCIEVMHDKFPNGIPKGQLYVTLGGLYADRRGKLIPGSEIDKVLKSGLVKGNQIVSVDCDKSVVDQNNKVGLGIKNVYMPLKHINAEGDKCPVKRGEYGGIERVVENLIEDGKIIAVLNADLMGMPKSQEPTITGMMFSLNKQVEPSLYIVNLALSCPFGKKLSNSVLDELKSIKWDGGDYEVFSEALRKNSSSHSVWREVPLFLNGEKGIEYTSGTIPMQTVFLSKTTNPDFVAFKEKEVVAVEVKTQTVPHEKLTSWSRNKKYSDTIIRNIILKVEAGESLVEICNKRKLYVPSIRTAIRQRPHLTA